MFAPRWRSQVPFRLSDRVSVPLFIKALWSEDKAIRTSAAEGLARAADPKALPELERAVSVEKEAGVKLAMEFAFTALAKEAPWWTGWARGYMATLPEHT